MTRKPDPIEWDATTTTAAAAPDNPPAAQEPSTLAH